MKIILFLGIVLLLPISIHASEVSNNSFENNTENWIKTASTVQFNLNSTDVKESSHSAEINYAATTSNGIKQIISPIIPGQSYKISAYIKSITAKKAFIRIAWYQEGNTSQLKTDDSTIVTSGTEWSLAELTASAPPNVTFAEIRLLVTEGSALFDQINLTKYIEPTDIVTPSLTPTLLPTLFPTFSPSPTPTQIPTIPHLLTYQNIYISEGFVYPDSSANEWIELYNANPYTVYLNNWYIDDVTDGGATPKAFTTTLLPNNYVVIEMTSSLLNNTGDTIQLLDSTKTIKDSITYTGSQQNKSIGRTSFSSSTVCIQISSKAKVNEPCINPNEDIYSISPSPTSTSAPSPSITRILTYTPTPHTLGIHSKLVRPTHILRKQSHAYEYSRKDKEFHEKTKKSEQKAIPILATAYSLLSFLSITAKMIIVRR